MPGSPPVWTPGVGSQVSHNTRIFKEHREDKIRGWRKAAVFGQLAQQIAENSVGVEDLRWARLRFSRNGAISLACKVMIEDAHGHSIPMLAVTRVAVPAHRYK
ncbi:hypothetical protein CABS01_16661 [Colletotrichum abscissum]|uniref:uncharacterized protein n=1 Tax=Colletotrichum abscissum TaxID=1671311 RepID=UPI0027D50465|nr:uncharacterized protein CABS01_16661 [Colletotrichum abscissum]KAK1517394.1 hypothetical protein CABS01_16661 [Colletotrichum abscissum]